jgi:hypothetical protein
VETAAVAGVQSFRTGWGTLFFDYNNDQLSDLYVCNQVSGGVGSPNNRHYIGSGAFPCIDIAAALNINNGGSSYAVATADVDNDGDLDMLVQAWNEPMRLYINHEGESRNWLKIKLLSAGPNRHAVGATIRIRTHEISQIRQIIDGIGYKSSSSLVAHFGLNSFTTVDEIVVTWPGGEFTSTLTNIAANQTITIVNCQPAMRGDFTGDGQITPEDLPSFIDALLSPTPMGDCLGDKNEDGRVDGRDIGAMVESIL